MAGSRLSGAQKRGRSKGNRRARQAAEAAASTARFFGVAGTCAPSTTRGNNAAQASPAEKEKVVAGTEAEECWARDGEEGAEQEEHPLYDKAHTIVKSTILSRNKGVRSSDPHNQSYHYSHSRCGSPMAEEIDEGGEQEGQEGGGDKEGLVTLCDSTYSCPTEAGDYDPEVEGQSFPSPPFSSSSSSPSPPPPYSLEDQGGHRDDTDGLTQQSQYVQHAGTQVVHHHAAQHSGHVQLPCNGPQSPQAYPPNGPSPYCPPPHPQPGIMHNGQNNHYTYNYTGHYNSGHYGAPPPMSPYGPDPHSWQPNGHHHSPQAQCHAPFIMTMPPNNAQVMHNNNNNYYNSNNDTTSQYMQQGAPPPPQYACYGDGSYGHQASPPQYPPHGFTGHPPYNMNISPYHHAGPYHGYNYNGPPTGVQPTYPTSSNYPMSHGHPSHSTPHAPPQYHTFARHHPPTAHGHIYAPPPTTYSQAMGQQSPVPPPEALVSECKAPEGYEVLPFCLDRVITCDPYGDTACAFDPRNGELITFYRMEGYTGPMVFETNYVHTAQGSFRKSDFYAGRVPPLCPPSSSSACGDEVCSSVTEGRLNGRRRRHTRGGKGKGKGRNANYGNNMPVAA